MNRKPEVIIQITAAGPGLIYGLSNYGKLYQLLGGVWQLRVAELD